MFYFFCLPVTIEITNIIILRYNKFPENLKQQQFCLHEVAPMSNHGVRHILIIHFLSFKRYEKKT